MSNKLLKYKIGITDDDLSGMSAIAFTKRPAIMVKGMAFNSQIKPQYFSDDLKYRICAPAMIPMDIYRYDDDGEYEVVFTEEVIEEIFSKFMKNYSSTKIFNLEHNPNKNVPAYILEAWIVDSPTTDKAFTTFGIEVPKGTLMLTTQITDKLYYEKLVVDGQTGYSIEGLLGMELSEMINKNKEKEIMKKTELSNGEVSAFIDLPVGTWTIGDKIYTIVEVVSNEGTDEEYRHNVIESMLPVEMAEEVIEAPIEEEVIEMAEEEVIEEIALSEDEEIIVDEEAIEMVEEVIEAPIEVPVTTETYTKEEVDAKLEELMKVIADLKSEMKGNVSEPVIEEVKLSAIERVANFANFSRQTPDVRL